jgi:hypothetical protein
VQLQALLVDFAALRAEFALLVLAQPQHVSTDSRQLGLALARQLGALRLYLRELHLQLVL